MAASASVSTLLVNHLANRLGAAELLWLRNAVSDIAGLTLVDPTARRSAQILYSQAVRHAPRTPLKPTMAESATLAAARSGLDVSSWTLDHVARAALLAALPGSDPDALLAMVDALAASADLQELIALYQSLPLLPHPPRWVARAAEGVRSNMRAVFAAIALDNPYPAEHLDEGAWH